MRNRESASESRSRKKDYLKELESRCRYLEDHCTNLQQVVHHTAMENLALKNELARAKNYTGTVCGEAEPAALESGKIRNRTPFSAHSDKIAQVAGTSANLLICGTFLLQTPCRRSPCPAVSTRALWPTSFFSLPLAFATDGGARCF